MKISVIIPAYNAQESLCKCIEALLKQSLDRQNYEIIVVNDGSIDSTETVVKNCPVKYIRQDNRGPASARNKGAKDAKGEIILFTDSDCVADENWIAEMSKPFEDDAVMGVKGAYKTEQKSVTARFAQIEFEERFEILKRVDSIDMVDTYSAGFRKDNFLKLGGFDISFPVANNEDTELSYRMSKLGLKMVFNPNAIVFHLNHPDSLIKYAKLKFWRGYWRMMVYKIYPDKMIKDTYTPQTLKLQILALFSSVIIISLMGFFHYLITLLYLSVAGFLLLTLPLTTFAIKRNIIVGILTPFFLFVRAASLVTGMLYGILTNFQKVRQSK